MGRRGALTLMFLSGCAERSLPDDADVGAEMGGDFTHPSDAGDGISDPGDGADDGGDGGGSYGACESGLDCDREIYCVHPRDEAGFCAAGCAGGVEQCARPSDGDAVPSCIDVEGNRVCALDCSDSRSCPDGMRCQAVSLGGTEATLCF